MRCLTLLSAGLLVCLSAAAAKPVELQKTGSSWQLQRDGKPYLIRGAGGTASLEQLAAAGANSIRTWGADDIGPLLDEAHDLGLSVTVGIWLGHERHGFDYHDAGQVKQQLERARATVLKYKDHPAVLLWGIGNEMEGLGEGNDPAVWAAVNDVAAMVKEVDPHHPTMTVTADIGGGRLEYVQEHCPNIDIHGINSYGGALSLPERYRAGGAVKPYIITEFGPPGPWESPKNEWGAAIELSSSDKAAFYRRSYQHAILDAHDISLGSYAFQWGFKMEATATWFGMFLDDGTRLAAIDVMTELWSGKPPANLSPVIESLTIDGEAQLEPGDELYAKTRVVDPENNLTNVSWALRPESQDYVTGGDFRPMLPDIEGAILDADRSGARIRMPEYPGPYRLFLYAYDDSGNAATANVPLFVKGKVRTRFPIPVYDDGFEGMPWVPSGWMGATEHLTLDGDHSDIVHDGKASVKLRLDGGQGWAGVAWQNPSNNWGNEDGGFNLSGAKVLTLWARGEYGGEKIRIGVGLLGENTDHPDSGITSVDGIVLKSQWKRYRIPLRKIDLSSIKTGFVVALSGRPTPVTVYLDRIRFER